MDTEKPGTPEPEPGEQKNSQPAPGVNVGQDGQLTVGSGDVVAGDKTTAGGHIVNVNDSPGATIIINPSPLPTSNLQSPILQPGSGQVSNLPSSIFNPFYTSGRINDPRGFFGRAQLVREIRAELKKRSSVSLVGESQMGKSSLLHYLYTTRAEWLPGVGLEYIDLQRVLDEGDFCETVLNRLGAEGNSLRQLKKVLETREVILLFDEVERIAEQDFSPRLHDLLRSLAQEQNFAMALVTQRPLEEVFPARTPGGVSPFHNIFTRKALGPFTEAEARAFLADRLANTPVAFTAPEVDRLLAESAIVGGCHPAKLQKLAKALFEEKVELT
jgi:hypothetical protein